MTVPTEPADPIASSASSASTEPKRSTAAATASAKVAPRVLDDSPLIPERSADDSDTGWHEGADSNDERLLRDVPPHW